MLYLEIFNKSYTEHAPHVGVHIPRDHRYLQRLYIYNRDTIVHYYQQRNFFVKNTHILSRYIEHIPPHFNYDLFRYIDYLDNKTTYLSKHFKFTSELERGIIHPAYFFGNDGQEIILSSNSIERPIEEVRQWKKIKPVSIIDCKRDDTRLLLPLGKDDGCKKSLSTVLLNPIKLALSYREFLRGYATGENELDLSKNVFMTKYVLPNTLTDIIDFVFLNRVIDKFYGIEPVTPRYKHRIKIFEPFRQLDRYASDTVDNITSRKLDFVNIMKNILLVFNKDSSELLQLPDIGYTRQVKWALLLSRIDYMIFLYDVSKDKGASRHIINDWKRLVLRLKQDSALYEEMEYTFSKELKEKIYKIENM